MNPIRRWLVLTGLCVILLTSTLITYTYMHLLELPLFSNKVNLENINSVVTDQEGRTYVLDKQQRILQWNSNGDIDLIIDAHDNWLKRNILLRDEQEFTQLRKITIDEQGNMYVSRSHFSRNRVFLQSEDIIRYNANGKPEGEPLYTRNYDPPLEHTAGQLTSLTISGDSLYFYEMNDEGLLLRQLELKSNTTIDILQIKIPQTIGIQNVTGWQSGHIYFTSKSGAVYQAGIPNHAAKVTSDITPLPQSSGSGKYPYRIGVSSTQQLYVADISRQQIVRFAVNHTNTKQDKPVVWLDESRLKTLGHETILNNISSMGIGKDGTVTIGAVDSVIQVKENGDNLRIIYQPQMSAYMILKLWALRLCALMIMISFVLIVRHIYIHFMNRKVSILIKQLLAFMIVLTILLNYFSSKVTERITEDLQNQIQEKLNLAIYLSADQLPITEMQALQGPQDFKSQTYLAMSAQNERILSGTTNTNMKEYYSELYAYRDGKMYILTDYGDPVGPFYPVTLTDSYQKVIQGETIYTEDIDRDGAWLEAVGPIYDQNRNIIGMHEIGVSAESLHAKTDLLYNQMFKLIMVSAPITAILFSGLTMFIMSSIRKLRASAAEMAAGHWGTRVHIGGVRDEINELGDQFNTMASQIEQYISSIQLLSHSYYRFVPKPFLDFLGKKDMTEVALGNQVEKEMCMMICSIRSFYQHTKGMETTEIFDLINLFLGSAGPRIRHAGGIINDYADASLFSLFPRWTEDAMEAALSIRGRLNEYNLEQLADGGRTLDVGIVIHRGNLLLGVVGEEERMANAVISEDVNTVFELERLSQQLGVSILITAEVYEALEQKNHYGIRDLGEIQPGVDEHTMRLYEVYDGDAKDQRRLKARTLETFDQGLTYFRDGRFLEARSSFLQIIRQNSKDEAAKLYFYLSDEYYSRGADEGWHGQLKMVGTVG
ncbi:HAMP domain-containing protein [Paenibacillus nuruki]|uniref:HAMP domain-containing protein n=1 Tax=Paenibacillus nuruki TaxID=1886670 RepID=UPI002805E393|nr:HAMP domain-containing protein [Paenibacillus nuruki]CAJ1317755.1 HAMP domain-containing protein [Paenibacillus nuruki]